MRTVKKTVERFRAEDGCELVVSYANQGEPYREGIQVSVEIPGGRYGGHFFMEEHEARTLRDLLNRLYPV